MGKKRYLFLKIPYLILFIIIVLLITVIAFAVSQEPPSTKYTFLLTIFTGILALLAFVNIPLWLSTSRIATATLGVELPQLRVYHLNFGSMGVANLTAKLQYPKIEVSVKNYGRTPAFIIKQAVEIVYGSLSSQPSYSSIINMAPETVIESQAIYDLIVRPDGLVSTEDYTSVIEGEKHLWIYGFISYQDFLNKAHEMRFCKQFMFSKVSLNQYSFGECDIPKYTESY